MSTTKKCRRQKSDIGPEGEWLLTASAYWRTRSWRYRLFQGFVSFVFLITLLLVSVACGGSSDAGVTETNRATPTTSATENTQTTSSASTVPRQITGTATTLGAGTFTGGIEVAAGLYDVTTSSGESGRFEVSGNKVSISETLGVGPGMDVKIRVPISNEDSIIISGLSNVFFTPVTTPLVTTQTTTILYAGDFTVGQDIAAGRYVATSNPGVSGTFMFQDGPNWYQNLLGDDPFNVTLNEGNKKYDDGNKIQILGPNQVTMTPR